MIKKLKMKIEVYEHLLTTVGESLKSHFLSLSNSQQTFIHYCSYNARLLFIEEQRFSQEESAYSDTYKIKTALSKVLALEYNEDISLARLPGTTETFYAVIALPVDGKELIEHINKLKDLIGSILKKYVDERVKLNGHWTPVNKALLQTIGKSRANLKQIKRRLNMHDDLYQRISLSCTESRPSYKKTKLELINLLKTFNTEVARADIALLDKYSDGSSFAYFYDKTYSVVDGNFRYKEGVVNDPSNDIAKNFKTQKISSPIYIISDDIQQIDTEIIFRNKEKKQKKRVCYKNAISTEKILMSLPVFEYL
jgi:hypothetical protein